MARPTTDSERIQLPETSGARVRCLPFLHAPIVSCLSWCHRIATKFRVDAANVKVVRISSCAPATTVNITPCSPVHPGEEKTLGALLSRRAKMFVDKQQRQQIPCINKHDYGESIEGIFRMSA